ncbi:Emp65p PWA37_002038 [Arxiozyma heterogenica]|uniref:Emp65p n=1 Tax=Arxiozyma heterogenica TaxID=278026 RepID=UPI002EE04E23
MKSKSIKKNMSNNLMNSKKSKSKIRNKSWSQKPLMQNRSRLKKILYELIDYQLEKGEYLEDKNIETTSDTNDIHTKNEKINIIADPNYELEQLINMIKIPFHLEKLMTFTLLASINDLLYFFTVLPINIFESIAIYKKDPPFRSIQTYKQRCALCLIITACLVLSHLDTSKVYHRIKRQNTMKLYMLFNVLEMCDKMLASMGQSLLNVTLSDESVKTYKMKRYKQILLVSLSAIYLIAHGYILIYQSISLNVAVNSYNNSLLALLLSLQFAEIKSSVFKKTDKEGLFQLSISDIVQRFKILLILIIIIIRNTGAIINNSMSNDVLSISTLIKTALHNHHFKSLTQKIMKLIWSPFVSIVSCEIIVDWMKHAYITKFNRIRPEIYEKFHLIMCKDNAVGISQFEKRLGLILPAYVVLSIVMIRPVMFRFAKNLMPLKQLPNSLAISIRLIWIIFISFIILLMLKVVMNSILKQLSKEFLSDQYEGTNNVLTTRVTKSDYVPGEVVDGFGFMDQRTRETIYCGRDDSESKKKIPLSIVEKRIKHDNSLPDSLETVTRYKMVSKRIW